jgi:hypothetical protein
VILRAIGAAFLIFSFWAVFGFALATVLGQTALAISLGRVPDRQRRLPFSRVWAGQVPRHPGTTRAYANATHAVATLLLYIVAFTGLSARLNAHEGRDELEGQGVTVVPVMT